MNPYQLKSFSLRILISFLIITFGLAKNSTDPNKLAPAIQKDGRYRVWVYFMDKGTEHEYNLDNVLIAIEAGLNEKTRWRRSKTRGNNLVDERDIPVFPEYVARLKSTGIQIRTVSKWLNAVSVTGTFDQIREIETFLFVKRIDPVYAGKRIEPEHPFSMPPSARSFRNDYGPSYDQLEQINVIAAHEAGYNGAGVRVLMLDTGYFKDHEAIHEDQIIAEWDFINNDGETQNEPNDPSGQHNHGTFTLSTLGGWTEGQLYGPAYGAEFLIAKTEDVSQEQPIEEDWYVAGLEWGESLGAEIASSSLGYIDWYTPDDLDGLTAVTTVAVNIAVENGMVVVTAAGNSGADGLLAPADAFNVIACGAVDWNGIIAWFSSQGPTADGRIKPEVCARGVDTYCAIPPGYGVDYSYVSGTSLSTPLVGGACALILQAHPDWTPLQVREALMMTANNADTPDNFYGWGIIDVMAAINYEQPSTYSGPVWHIATDGSDETGDGSEDFPFASIQQGINTASAQDTVLVAPGTYLENINFNGNNIVLGSWFLVLEDTAYISQTVIDGNQDGSVVKFENGEDSTAVLSGFTITNGLDPGLDGNGIYCKNSSPTLRHLRIVENRNLSRVYQGSGGGIYFDNSQSKLSNVFISENSAEYGAGLFAQFSELKFTHVDIIKNTGIPGGFAGTGNGAGIHSYESILTLKNCNISDNDGSMNIFGGGLSLILSTINLTNVSICNNISVLGGGIFSADSEIILANSILWNNLPQEISGSVNVFYSDIQGGWEGEGNIDSDPLFVDPENSDYYLLENSPCINAGTAFFVWEGDTLVNLDQEDYFGFAPDMGAYEFEGTGTSQYSVDHVADWNLIGLPLQVFDPAYAIIFPDALEGTLYSFNVGYFPVDSLTLGTGYWLRFSEVGTNLITGIPINEITLQLTDGWNLISGISVPAPFPGGGIFDPAGIIIPGTLYGFEVAYTNTETILPGKGYWIRASNDGEITITDIGSDIIQGGDSVNKLEGENYLEFTNLNGYSGKLYFGVLIPEEERLSYSLPPKPPMGAFDIRFTGDWRYVNETGVIEIMNNTDIISISFTVRTGEIWRLYDSEKNTEYLLTETGTIRINGNTERLFLSKQDRINIPVSYTLHQNYPNPFNPVTTISYDLPNDGQVIIQVFDLKGRAIAELVNGFYLSGFYSIRWDASLLTSGVYFVKMQSGDYVKFKKVMLLK